MHPIDTPNQPKDAWDFGSHKNSLYAMVLIICYVGTIRGKDRLGASAVFRLILSFMALHFVNKKCF